METTESSEAQNYTLELNYDKFRSNVIDFLTTTKQDLIFDNKEIKNDIDAGEAVSAQIEDFVYNQKIIESINNILSYFGVEQ